MLGFWAPLALVAVTVAAGPCRLGWRARPPPSVAATRWKSRSEGSFAEGPPGIFEVEREAARRLLLEAWTSLPLQSRMGVPLLLGRHQSELLQQQQQHDRNARDR